MMKGEIMKKVLLVLTAASMFMVAQKNILTAKPPTVRPGPVAQEAARETGRTLLQIEKKIAVLEQKRYRVEDKEDRAKEKVSRAKSLLKKSSNEYETKVFEKNLNKTQKKLNSAKKKSADFERKITALEEEKRKVPKSGKDKKSQRKSSAAASGRPGMYMRQTIENEKLPEKKVSSESRQSIEKESKDSNNKPKKKLSFLDKFRSKNKAISTSLQQSGQKKEVSSVSKNRAPEKQFKVVPQKPTKVLKKPTEVPKKSRRLFRK